MADITLTCAKCGKQITVSEHVSVDAIPCAACGGQFDVTRKRTEGRAARLKPNPEPPAPETAHPEKPSFVPDAVRGPVKVAPMAVKSRMREARMARERRMAAITSVNLRLSIVLFVVLGAAAYYLRWHFAPSLPPAEFAAFKDYGIKAVGVAYVIIILIALKDNMFDGLLSLVVPFYPFYYLFAVSSAIFMRAIVGALLIAAGFDACVLMQALALRVYDVVSYWIRNQ